MAPSWFPKSNPNREKIDAKINQTINAFQDRFLYALDKIWKGKWKKVGTKIEEQIEANFEKIFFEKKK